MFYSRILFSISINETLTQYEECICLLMVDDEKSALQMALEEMKLKACSFINTNGDMVRWLPEGIVKLEPVELNGSHMVLDSQLLQSVSDYTKDHLYYKCTDLVNE